MKKLIIILLIMALLLVFVLPWWGGEEEPNLKMQPTVLTENFEGIFVGELPCADCGGIETTIQLFSDGRYELTENYDGKGIFTSTGNWKRMPQTQKINLINDNQFYEITSENNLYRLNDQGERTTSEFNMILTKQ